jgi:hypothetical protein
VSARRAPRARPRPRRRAADGTQRGRASRSAAKPRAARGSAAPLDWSSADPAAIPLTGLHPRSLISPHFCAYELTRSELADRHGIENVFPSERELRAAVHLAREVLEPLRARFGAFTPNSVFRSQALERRLKGKPSDWLSTSQHTQGEACDVEIVGVATLALAEWAAASLRAFDQIICECYDETKGPSSGWVHISIVPPAHRPNRRNLLSYIKDPVTGKMVYVEGLRGSLV